MYELPNGRVITRPQKHRMIVIGGEQHPETNLLYWPPAKRQAMGIKDVVVKGFDAEHFEKTGEARDETVPGLVTVTPTVQPRLTPAELAGKIKQKVKAEGMALYRASRNRHQELSALDPADPELDLHVQFWADLKAAYDAIVAGGQAIVTGTDTVAKKYQDLLAYTWTWPTSPGS